MRGVALLVFALASCRAQPSDGGQDTGPLDTSSPLDTSVDTRSPLDTAVFDGAVDVDLPEAWTAGPFATGDWTTASLDGGKCVFKVAHGATRDARALRWEACGSGCRRNVTDWAAKGYRLAAERRPTENDKAEVLAWVQIYPNSLGSPEYTVSVVQPLNGSVVHAAIGQVQTKAFNCEISLHGDGAGTVYLAEREPVVEGAKGIPLGRVDAPGLSLVRYFAYKDLSERGTATHVWSTLSDGFLHVQTEPAGLAVIKLDDGPVVTKSLVTPNVELPRKVSGGSIGGDYGSYGALWYVGNDGASAKIYTTTAPNGLLWFDVDRRRGDTVVWAEQAEGGTPFTLWESPIAKTAGGAKPRKLHSQASTYGVFVANAGAVMFLGAAGQIKIVRASDGTTETLTVPATDRALEPVWVDEKEVWFTSEPAATVPAGSARSWIVRLAR